MLRLNKAARGNDYYLDLLKRKHPDVFRDLLANKYKTVADALKVAGIKKARTPLQEMLNAWNKASQVERDATFVSTRYALAASYSASVLMFMPLVEVRIVWVAMAEAIMAMPMRMWLGDGSSMVMLVVGVVHVGMLALERLMKVFMVVTLGEMQPEAKRHQTAGEHNLD